jgi:uncharacterized protein (TIRG00374 family)
MRFPFQKDIQRPPMYPTQKGRQTPAILRVALSFVLLLYFFLKIDLWATLRYLTTIPMGVLAASFALLLISLWLNAYKWHLLLPRYGILELGKINLIGRFYGLVLPGQLAGEGAKGYLLYREKRDSREIVASILLDRLTGLVGLAIVLVLGLSAGQWGGNQEAGLWVLLVLLALALPFLLNAEGLLNHLARFLSGIAERLPRFRGILSKAEEAAADTAGYSVRIGLLLKTTLLGFLFQIDCVVGMQILGSGLGMRVGFLDWCLVFGVLSLALLLPISLGGIGLREGSLIALLGNLGIPAEKSLALSMAIFGIQLLPTLAGGILSAQTLSRKK